MAAPPPANMEQTQQSTSLVQAVSSGAGDVRNIAPRADGAAVTPVSTVGLTSAATSGLSQRRPVPESPPSATCPKNPLRYAVISCAMAPGRFPTFRDAVLFDQTDWIAYRTPLPAVAAPKGRSSAERRMYQVVVGMGLRKVLGSRLKLMHLRGNVRPYMDGVLQGVQRILANHFATGVEILEPICCGAGRAWHEKVAGNRPDFASMPLAVDTDGAAAVADEAEEMERVQGEAGTDTSSAGPSTGTDKGGRGPLGCVAAGAESCLPLQDAAQPVVVASKAVISGTSSSSSVSRGRADVSGGGVSSRADSGKLSRRMEDRPAAIIEADSAEDVHEENLGRRCDREAPGEALLVSTPRPGLTTVRLIRGGTDARDARVRPSRREPGRSAASRQPAAVRPATEETQSLHLRSRVPPWPCGRLARRLGLPELSSAPLPAPIGSRPTSAGQPVLVPIRKRRRLLEVLGGDVPRYKVAECRLDAYNPVLSEFSPFRQLPRWHELSGGVSEEVRQLGRGSAVSRRRRRWRLPRTSRS